MKSEKSFRRWAEKQGLQLKKVRDRADEYILADARSNLLVFPGQYGETRIGATLEEVDDFLSN